jgi:hypothetical protein
MKVDAKEAQRFVPEQVLNKNDGFPFGRELISAFRSCILIDSIYLLHLSATGLCGCYVGAPSPSWPDEAHHKED